MPELRFTIETDNKQRAEEAANNVLALYPEYGYHVVRATINSEPEFSGNPMDKVIITSYRTTITFFNVD